MVFLRQKTYLVCMIVVALFTLVILGGCDNSGSGNGSAPRVVSTTAMDEAVDVMINADITATFDKEMNGASVNSSSFMVTAGTLGVAGTVSYDESTKKARFSPVVHLAAGTLYTATITTEAKDLAGNSLTVNKVWTFTTVNPENLGTGPAGGPGGINLGTAANYAILAKTGVSTTGTTMVTGNIGLSPASQTQLTGFSETLDGGGTFSTSVYVTGQLFAADYTDPTPTILTTAISDMETAYTSAAGLMNPDFTNLGAGEIGGLTLEPGLYKWGTGVLITTDVTLWGSGTGTWVFQIAGDLTLADGVKVTRAGGALPENIVWQVGSNASLGTTSHFEGILLTSTNIPVNTGATVNGRLLAQTAVTLDANGINQP